MGNEIIFDQLANRYDTSDRIAIASLSADKIRNNLINTKDKSAIDFGCGTGLIGLALLDEFKRVMFLDASANMIKCVKEKIEHAHIKNATAICFDIEENIIDIDSVDYILMTQVLLHIKDTNKILEQLYSLLNPGGHLLLVDFDKNDSVNSEMIHNGFEQKELSKQLMKVGFEEIKSHTFHHDENLFMKQEASLFLMDARK